MNDEALPKLEGLTGQLDGHLDGDFYICKGGQPTVADFYLFTVFRLYQVLDKKCDIYPRVNNWAEECMKLDGIKVLYDDNSNYMSMTLPFFKLPSHLIPEKIEHSADEDYKVEYLGIGTCVATEGPMWSEDHQCFYYVDLMKKSATMWRLRIGEEPEPMNLVDQGELKMTFVVDTTEPNVFFAGFHDVGLAKLIIEPESNDV